MQTAMAIGEQVVRLTRLYPFESLAALVALNVAIYGYSTLRMVRVFKGKERY